MTTRKSALTSSEINRHLFLDKLCERWIFERSATHLYELALARLEEREAPVELRRRLQRFGQEERLHADMLEALCVQLGQHPREHAATPSANLAAAESEALLELCRGHELGSTHVLEVLVAAEALDVSGWELLLALGKEASLDEEWLRSFRAALSEEQEHMHVARAWAEKLQSEELFEVTAPLG